jgi:hypothetical protein
MGFTIYYRSTRPVSPARADAVAEAALDLCRGRSWLGCEPVGFFSGPDDGHLFGGSKPNFQPHPDDAASAARSGLPDGTTRDMLDVLCRLSRDHQIDWELMHDHSDGPVGRIRRGVCDNEVLALIEGCVHLCDFFEDPTADFESEIDGFPPPASGSGERDEGDEDDDGGPSILPFRPRGD